MFKLHELFYFHSSSFCSVHSQNLRHCWIQSNSGVFLQQFGVLQTLMYVNSLGQIRADGKTRSKPS